MQRHRYTAFSSVDSEIPRARWPAVLTAIPSSLPVTQTRDADTPGPGTDFFSFSLFFFSLPSHQLHAAAARPQSSTDSVMPNSSQATNGLPDCPSDAAADPGIPPSRTTVLMTAAMPNPMKRTEEQ